MTKKSNGVDTDRKRLIKTHYYVYKKGGKKKHILTIASVHSANAVPNATKILQTDRLNANLVEIINMKKAAEPLVALITRTPRGVNTTYKLDPTELT